MRKVKKENLISSNNTNCMSVTINIPPKVLKKMKPGSNVLTVSSEHNSSMTIVFIGCNHSYYVNGKKVKI